MSSTDKNDKDPLGRILSYLVAISTIIGIPAGLYGYFSSQHDKRVEKTFEFYKTFRSAELEKNWSLLIGRWNNNAKEARALIAQGKTAEFDDFVIGLVAEAPGPGAMEHVLSFFDELSACVSNSLCDGNTAYALFKEPAHQFAGAYGPYVLHVRQEFGNQKYGTGLFQTRALERTLDIF
jgi:hypothetical protein